LKNKPIFKPNLATKKKENITKNSYLFYQETAIGFDLLEAL